MEFNTYSFFILSLMASLVTIFFGNKYMNNPPEKISYSNGYCTKRSTKNKEMWLFSQKKFGKIWYYSGIFTLAVSALTIIFIFKCSKSLIFIVGIIIFAIQGLLMMSPLLFVEQSLKQNFDNNGNRK